MKLLLTSFGVGQDFVDNVVLGAHMAPQYSEVFYRMPPVSMHQSVRVFRPDYSVLILADKLVLDDATFDLLQERRGPYRLVAEAVLALHKEGFIELKNYSHVLDENAALLGAMIENDLQSPKQWESAFERSVAIWHQFAWKLLYDEPPDTPDAPRARIATLLALRAFEHLTDFVRRDKAPTRSLRTEKDGKEVLKGYLRYVNANIVLANQLSDGAFHDWADFCPSTEESFYTWAVRMRPTYLYKKLLSNYSR
jgi:hypothetical protein